MRSEHLHEINKYYSSVIVIHDQFVLGHHAQHIDNISDHFYKCFGFGGSVPLIFAFFFLVLFLLDLATLLIFSLF